MIAMRNRILKSRLYKIVLWLILISMGGSAIIMSPFLRRDASSSSQKNELFAQVNQQEVYQKDYLARLAQIVDRIQLFKRQFGAQSDLLLKFYGLDNPQELAARGIIVDELLNQVAQKMKIQLTESFIAQQLQNPVTLFEELRDVIPYSVLTPQGTIDATALRYVLQSRGQTLDDFERDVQHGLERKMVTDLVGLGSYVSQKQVKEAFSRYYQSRALDILTFPYDYYLTQQKKNVISDNQLKEFFDAQNKESKRYWVPEKRAGSYWTFEPDKYGITISDKAIQNYYDEQKLKQFVAQPAQVSVRRILFAVDKDASQQQKQETYKLAQEVHKQAQEQPSNFVSLVKKHSQDDKKIIAKDGLVPFFSRGQKEKNIERAAFRLKQDGDISDVIQSTQGYEIMQRVERKKVQYKDIDEVRNNIIDILRQKKFKKLFAQEAQNAYAQGDNKKDTHSYVFEQFVQSKNAHKQNIELQECAEDDQILKKLFKTKKNKFATFVYNGKGFVVHTTEIQKTHQPSLSQVKDKVKQDAYEYQAQQALASDVKKAYLEAQRKSLKEVKQAFNHAQLSSSGMIKQDEPKSYEHLTQKAIPVEQLLTAQKEGQRSLAFAKDNAYVAKVTEMEQFDQDLFNEKKDELSAELHQQAYDLTNRGFIASLYDSAKINLVQEPYSQEPIAPDSEF